MDLIEIVEAEHRHVERLFERFERAVRSENAGQQLELARDIRHELSAHAAVEEQVLYPALQRAGVSEERLDALEEHHAVKVALSELQAMRPGDERFAAKMHVVEKGTRLHVQEEESTLLPRLREALPAEALQTLGLEFAALRRSAPTRPHPASPDSPPANYFTNAAAALLDRLLDSAIVARGLLRSTAQQLLAGTVRAGRDMASRTRWNGKVLVEQARATGERALQRTRVLGVEVLEGAVETGHEVAERIEHRTEVAARELAGRVREKARVPRTPRRARPRARARARARA